MNAALRRRFEMGARVRNFLREHPTEGAEAAALTHLEQLLERGEKLAAQQSAGVIAARGSTAQRSRVRRALLHKLLMYLTGVGAVAAKENAALEAEFRMPPNGIAHQAFLTVARGMLEKAVEHKELLVKQGLSEGLFADLTAALEEFEQSLEATRSGRLAHVGASTDLQAVATEISEQVRLLEGLVRYRFGNAPELMGAWASARNVVSPVRTQEPPLPEGEEKVA